MCMWGKGRHLGWGGIVLPYKIFLFLQVFLTTPFTPFTKADLGVAQLR